MIALDEITPTVFRRTLRRSVLTPPLLFGLVALIFLGQILYLLSAAKRVDHSDRAVDRANYLLRSFVDGETGMWGYLITSDPVFLEPYRVEEAHTAPVFEELNELVADDTAQCERLTALKSQHTDWQAFAQRMIKLHREGGDYLTPVRNLEGKRRMDAIRARVSTFIRVEEERRKERARTVRRATWAVIGASFTLALVLGSGLAWMIRRQLLSVVTSYQHSQAAVVAQAGALYTSAQRLDALHEIDRATLAADPLPELTRSALRLMEPVVPSRHAFVVVFDPGAGPTQVIARTDTFWEMADPTGETFPALSGRDFPQAIADLAQLTERTPVQEFLFRSGQRSCVVVPLRAEERLFGVLLLTDPRSSAFTDGHQQVADEVAQQLVIAFRQDRLRDLVRRHTDELEQRVVERTAGLETVTVALRLQIDGCKRAEEELRERTLQLRATDRRLAELVEGMSEACFVLDAGWRFTFVNDRSEALLRYRREDMLGEPIWNVFGRLVGTPMEAHYHRAMTDRVPVSFVTFSPIAERWLDIRLFPTGDGLAAFLLDIHDRKLAEDALHASQARLNSALTAGSIGTWTWDIINDRLTADEFTARVFSIEPDAAANGLPAEVYLRAVQEEDRPGIATGLASAIASCGHYDIEYRVRQQDGELHWLQAKGRVEGDGAGHAVTFHGAVMDVTERKRTEGRLRRLVDSNAQGVIFWNTKGAITAANDAFLRIVGYTRENLEAGRIDWAAMTPPEYAHLDRRALGELATEGICTPFEKEYVRKDGSRVPILLGAAIFEDSPDEGVCFLLDITERKRAEVALQESEERFRGAFEHTNVAMVLTDYDNRFVRVNEAFVRLFGYTEAELLTMGLADLTHPDHLAESYAQREALLATGTSFFETEKRYRHRDGHELWGLTNVSLVRGPAGRPHHYVGQVQDISERKRTADALRESEERFRFLHDLVEATRSLADPTQIMAVTARMLSEYLRASRCAYAEVAADGDRFTILHDYTDGCASTVGEHHLSLFGAAAVATLIAGQTLIVRNVDEELCPDDGADTFNAIGIKAIVTCPLVKEGGLRAMMAVHQTTPRDWTGGEIAIIRDVVERCWATIERRTAEEQIRRLNVELEQRIGERTAQLEDANKDLEAFSYSVSHDLRAPLRAIDGFSRIVTEDFGPSLPPDAARYLQLILSNARQMSQLVDDLLAFSRLGNQLVARQPVVTANLVQGCLAELLPAVAGRKVDVRVGNLADCRANPALLKQVWFNLLANALKYTGKREAAVVEVGSTLGPDGPTYFVRDNGAGFDMRYADKLFGVFQRLHRASEYEGTGVGLAIVQRIVQRHGGRVWAEAELGRGATFFFTIPVDREAMSA
ncbi:PAS domain S-box protein [Gemmata sp. G18]|uniref:histidine kinase n=1 Tax=Gemmata palustris TaxID=2822762 RepID=A0ABS5BMD5_9BACT|nr:PAS domain S-box protein [Gemmata palustris]MBP3954861.1 PAS domain S-box protein [Gemmata palustris]